MRGNLSSPGTRWRRGDALAAHDRLPPPLRAWAAQAALPWSPASLARLWHRARAEGADEAGALARLAAAEAATLARHAPRVWGPGHPAAERRGGPSI